MKNHSRELFYREPYLIDGVQVSLFESGHVLGGATVTISHENKTIFLYGRYKYERLEIAEARRPQCG